MSWNWIFHKIFERYGMRKNVCDTEIKRTIERVYKIIITRYSIYFTEKMLGLSYESESDENKCLMECSTIFLRRRKILFRPSECFFPIRREKNEMTKVYAINTNYQIFNTVVNNIFGKIRILNLSLCD